MESCQDYDWQNRKFINQGSFAEVYQVREVATGRMVAVKELHKSDFPTKKYLDLLYQEIEIMKDLQHPHIIQLIQTFQTSESCFLVMQLADSSLRGFLDTKYRMTESDATKIFQDVAQGIIFMVEKDYIHRDVKPENILQVGDKFKLADFGFATKSDMGGTKKMNLLCGTPLYMAPQILQEKAYTSKCDIWSWGLVLYQIIFGISPWPCRNEISYLRAIKNTPLRFPYSTPISEQTKDFIRKCLIYDDYDRMGWDQFFRHDFMKALLSPPALQKKFTDSQHKALSKISKMIIQKNINIKHIFEQYKSKTGRTSLQQRAWTYFIKKIDSRLTNFEATQLFLLFDSDRSGSVQMQQVVQMLSEYDFQQDNKAQTVIKQLRQIIQNYNIDVRNLFKKIDFDRSGEIGIHEFKQFMRSVAPGLKSKEVLDVFAVIDVDKQGTIAFDQFCHILGGENTMGKQTQYAKIVLRALRSIMIERQIAVMDLMQQFDPDNNGLDQAQFLELIYRIDSEADPEEVSQMFIYVSKGTDNITGRQLYEALNSA